MSEPDQIRYFSRTLERLDNFRQLDDSQPFEHSHIIPAYTDSNNTYHPEITVKNTLPVLLLHKLKGIAIASEYSLAKSQGNGEIAKFLLHPPTLKLLPGANPLRNKDGGTR